MRQIGKNIADLSEQVMNQGNSLLRLMAPPEHPPKQEPPRQGEAQEQ